MEYVLHQFEETSCGSACLKMLLANLYKKEDYLYINYVANNASLEELIIEANKYGVSLSAFDTSEDKTELMKVKKPIIAVIKLGSVNHYVYIKNPARKILKIYDPSYGKYYLTYKTFLNYFTGYFVEVTGYEKTENFQVPKPKKPIKPFVLDLGLQLLALIAFLGAMFTMNEAYPLLAPLSFLGISVLLTYLERLYINRLMRQFDQNLLDQGLDLKIPLNSLSLKTVMDYKRIIFSRPLLLMNTLMSIGVVILFITLNNPRHLLGLIFAILGMLIIDEIHYIFKGKQLLLLGEAEQNAYQHGQLNSASLNDVQAISKQSYEVGKTMISLNLLKEVVSAACLITVMATSGVASLNYFLFYYFLYKIVISKVSELPSNTGQQLNEYDYKGKFLQLKNKTGD